MAAATRPSEFPEFASVDTFNGPSGEINFLEPSEAKKDQGWDFAEFPPRETMNWIHRRSFEWLLYLQESTGRRNFRYFRSQN